MEYQYYTFSIQELASAVRELAVKRPDFNYTGQLESGSKSCSYLTAGIGIQLGEGCIVGQALQKLGVQESDLQRVEGVGASSVHGYLTGIMTPISDLTRHWLGLIQMYQDEGATWGKALELADQNYK